MIGNTQKYGDGKKKLSIYNQSSLPFLCEASHNKGALIQENKSATLSCNNDQTLFVPKAYGICSKHSNSMMSDNPNSGFYEADTARTIDILPSLANWV